MTKAEVLYSIKKYEGKAEKYYEIFKAFGHVDPALMQYTLSYHYPDETKEDVELCKIIFAIDRQDKTCHALDPIPGPNYQNKEKLSLYAMRTVMPIAMKNLTNSENRNFVSHITVRENGSFCPGFEPTDNSQTIGQTTYYENVKTQDKTASDAKQENAIPTTVVVPETVQ